MSRVWIFAAALAFLSFNAVGRTNEDRPVLLTAEGTIDRVDKDSLTLTTRGVGGRAGKSLVLKLTGTSQVSMLTTQKRGDKVVFGQRDLELEALKSRQAIAVIYTAPDHVLLTAVALPSSDHDLAGALLAGVPAK